MSGLVPAGPLTRTNEGVVVPALQPVPSGTLPMGLQTGTRQARPFLVDSTGALIISGGGGGGGSITVTSTPSNVEKIQSDKDTQFAGAINQGEQATANLTGLSSNNVQILSVVLLAEQNLDWDVLIWGTDGFNNADLDLDSLLEVVRFKASDAVAISNGTSTTFRYAITNVLIPYIDADGTTELHVSLIPRSAAKTAGAASEVVLKFLYRANAAGGGSGGVVLSGMIFDYGGTSAPTGYLLCDGTAVSRTTYSDLFTAIGTNYGVGDGSTTFNVPDFRGRAGVGTGAGSGLTPRLIGASGGDESLQSHDHDVTVRLAGASTTRFSAAAFASALTTSTQTGVIQNAGAGAAENMQPFLVATKIIKT